VEGGLPESAKAGNNQRRTREGERLPVHNCLSGRQYQYIYIKPQHPEQKGHKLFILTSAPLDSRKSTSSSPSLILHAIINGVHPDPSCASTSNPLVCDSSSTIGLWLYEHAQCTGNRSSESLRAASLGFAERRDSTWATKSVHVSLQQFTAPAARRNV
jgi:hypothetical protein